MGHSGCQTLFQVSFVGIDVNERVYVCDDAMKRIQQSVQRFRYARLVYWGRQVLEKGVETVIDSDCLCGVDVLLYTMYKQRVVRAFGNSTADLDWIPAQTDRSGHRGFEIAQAAEAQKRWPAMSDISMRLNIVNG